MTNLHHHQRKYAEPRKILIVDYQAKGNEVTLRLNSRRRSNRLLGVLDILDRQYYLFIEVAQE